MFVVFINDIAHLFTDNTCTCKLYADDLKLYTLLHTNTDCCFLQSKLNEVSEWSRKWQLTISHTKCSIMYVGNTNCNVGLSIILNDNVLPVVNEVKDLGVIVDSRLSFNAHINHIVARAFTRANLIHKCFTSRDAATLWRAFTVYVRPMLEYATCVWSPHGVGQVNRIESVQRKFTKRLPGYDSLDYKSRLMRLHADSLELRRLRYDLIYTYNKIVFGLVNGTANDLFMLTSLIHSSGTRGHAYKLFPHCNRVDLCKYFFSQRIIDTWNSLPARPNDFSSLARFKRFIYFFYFFIPPVV